MDVKLKQVFLSFFVHSADVVDMLDKMIKAVDQELSEEGLMLIGEAVLPHIKHWNRLVTLLRGRTVAVTIVLPTMLGVSALAILAAVAFAPIYLSYECVSENHLFCEYGDTDVDGCLGSSNGFCHAIGIAVSWIIPRVVDPLAPCRAEVCMTAIALGVSNLCLFRVGTCREQLTHRAGLRHELFPGTY